MSQRAAEGTLPEKGYCQQMELETEASRRQYGKRASQYASSASHAGGPDLARLIGLLQPAGTESVLDVATGTGHTALATAPHVASVVGVDPTPEMLVEARRLAAERDIPNVTFLVGQAEHLPCADASFDLVTGEASASSLSEHSCRPPGNAARAASGRQARPESTS